MMLYLSLSPAVSLPYNTSSLNLMSIFFSFSYFCIKKFLVLTVKLFNLYLIQLNFLIDTIKLFNFRIKISEHFIEFCVEEHLKWFNQISCRIL